MEQVRGAETALAFEAIRRLAAEYNRAFDEGRADDWAECFTVDGVFHRSDTQEYIGRQAIADLARSYPGEVRHVTSDYIIDVDSSMSEAKMTSYLLLFDKSENFALDLFGVYFDDVVKVDGKWKFKKRYLKTEKVQR